MTMSVRWHNWTTTWPNLTNFCACRMSPVIEWPWLGSLTSGFVGDAIFSHNGPMAHRALLMLLEHVKWNKCCKTCKNNCKLLALAYCCSQSRWRNARNCIFILSYTGLAWFMTSLLRHHCTTYYSYIAYNATVYYCFKINILLQGRCYRAAIFLETFAIFRKLLLFSKSSQVFSASTLFYFTRMSGISSNRTRRV